MTLDELRGRLMLSALWVTVLLNALLRDAHEVLRPGFLQEVMGGSLNGTALDDGLFIAAALVLQLPVAMVVLSIVLSGEVLRWIGPVAAGVALVALAAADRVDPDDRIFAAAQGIALLMLVAANRVVPKPTVG